MNAPEHLLYTKSHEWVLFAEDGSAKVGLTDHAQDALGDIVFVNLPEAGDSLAKGEALGDVESVKAVNESLLDAPESINADPYGAWLVEVEDISDKEELLDAAAYAAHCASEG